METAAGSWEAIATMTKGTFDLAVIDLDVPPARGMALTGWDLARIFRAFNPGLQLILVAAECSPGARMEAERLAHVRLLEKPVNPLEFRSIVRGLRGLPAAGG